MAKRKAQAASVQPLAPHKPIESTGFYNMPDSPASDLLFEVLGAGAGVAGLPDRKALINHGATVTVLEGKGDKNRNKRKITVQTAKAELSVELADIEKLAGSNKTAKKLLALALIKANEQAIHDGVMTRDYVSFPLQELIDIGFYSTPQSARKGFNAGMDTLTSIKVAGKTKKTSKKEIVQEGLRVPFTGADIDRGQCYIYLNDRINWAFLVQYFTLLPRYYFKLSNRGSDLLYYIFYLARQRTREIAERGYFTISFRALQQRLQLPSETGNNNPDRTIKQPIEEAIEELETEHSLMYDNTDFQLLPVYDEAASISTFLDKGYLKVTLLGDFAKSFIDMSQETARQIEQAQKRQERITEKAVAIKTAKAMEEAEKKERTGT